MEILENELLNRELESCKSIGVDSLTGNIIAVKEDETLVDITNLIMELTVVACMDKPKSISAFNRYFIVKAEEH
jgi:hypothetical protein